MSHIMHLPIDPQQQHQSSPPPLQQLPPPSQQPLPSQSSPQQQQQQGQQPLQPDSQAAPPRKRKKNDNPEEPHTPSEPRRLRRSHEACARCRSKKIKCDSKHPRCTACATAGAICQQEDRHRQTLTPRGHTERVEHQLAQCNVLLSRFIQGFTLDQLDLHLAREGLSVDNPAALIQTSGTFQFDLSRADPNANPGLKYLIPPHYGPGGYPMPMPPYPVPPGTPFPPPPPPGHIFSGPGPYPLNLPYPPPPHLQVPPPPPPPPSSSSASSTPRGNANDIRGQDPDSNDMSTTHAIARTFGVTPAIMNELAGPDREDLAVGSAGLTSGRDRDIAETSMPRDPGQWKVVTVRRNSQSGTLSGFNPMPGPVKVWLPKNRTMLKVIVDVYFSRLNVHRPVFPRKEFEKTLNDLYEGMTVAHDPGFVCSLYLILALGTLSELNHKAVKLDDGVPPGGLKQLMPPDWPNHDDFFERALTVKPDLRVTISSLQALILLQWYLYTERQGRSLWRLVGSMVRLSVELGLHHDPTRQRDTFSDDECELRVRLWSIVLMHDRGTSILLGRPLGISPEDSNTPHPTYTPGKQRDFSEDFMLSFPIIDIQAMVVNSLYRPKEPDSDWEERVIRTKKIISSISEFRRTLPEPYKYYFGETESWSLEDRSKLVQRITEDQGLTLLKLWIARILMLRALFVLNDLPYRHRELALKDAIVTAHNIIVIHNQLIRFPDIAFLTSPIPLHIAAMVILYGQMSKCKCLTKDMATEDLALALSQLPRFRWRWERKDVAGEHPLITKLAERVMEVDLSTVRPPTHPVLLPEMVWEEGASGMPMSQQTTPTLVSTPYPGPSPNHPVYGPHQQPMMNGASPHSDGRTASNASTPPDRKLAEVPPSLFYPFYPEAHVQSTPPADPGQPSTSHGPPPHPDYQQLLAAAAGHQFAFQGSADCFMSEERDPNYQQSTGMVWVAGSPAAHQRPPPPPHYAIPPQP